MLNDTYPNAFIELLWVLYVSLSLLPLSTSFNVTGQLYKNKSERPLNNYKVDEFCGVK